MKKRWMFVVFILVVFSLSMTTAKAEKPISLVFQSNYPATHSRIGDKTPIGDVLRAIEKDSGGRIKLERHWAGEPVPKKETLEGVGKGIIDMLLSAQTYYSGKIAIADHGIMPKNFRTNDDIFDLWWNTPMGKIIDDVYQKRANAKVIAPMPFSNYVIQVRKGSKKIRKFEDFKGRKMRAPGGMAAMAAKGHVMDGDWDMIDQRESDDWDWGEAGKQALYGVISVFSILIMLTIMTRASGSIISRIERKQDTAITE